MIWASYDYEIAARGKGLRLIAGADEVGRGCLAGPLMVGVVVLSEGCELQVADSKLLSAKKRAVLTGLIKQQAVGWSLGRVEHTEIDELGLSAAIKLAYERALDGLGIEPDRLVIDGPQRIIDQDFVEPIVKADQKVACVAAASIIAKVARDEWMQQQADAYPHYGFASNVGYGSPQHLAALKEYGPSPIHRRSFKVKSHG
jgi:ribonuclease HII